ncbi:protein asteroid homolog 1-like [Acanthochromis polyacanthus]|uniref:protein asteroid homolog 1-like n=1 Tax=Acanthochromis polyacanthus TaxID=80966 RepID=UPI002234E5A8|nr:protein asteroid homolog 1-like [Acanthochromis polyacanthus]
MGVQGLATLLDNNQGVYKDVKFRKSKLVVDGTNLIYLLYYNSGLDQNHGGEYAAFEALIKRFIAVLRTCEVTPYVVLDGGSDLTDKKLETVTKRAEDRIKKAHQAAVEGGKKDILPPLIWRVFKQTLARLEVPVAQCFGEADQEIAALASEWNCPVLSGDSDFYIFDLPAGLLPFCYFQWEDEEQDGSQSISCKTYHISRFCDVFKIQQKLLPTFAVLGGNDYVNRQRISWTQFAPSGSKTPNRLEGLLCWLKGFQQPQQALNAAVVELMGKVSENSKAELLKNLSEGKEEYQVPSSSLKGFLLNEKAPLTPAVKEVGSIHQVPDWIRLQLRQARLTPDVLDVLLLKRMSLSVTVGHKDQPSVNLTSRPLRQVMYGLLLGEQRSVPVKERDREGLKLTFIPVKPTFSRIAQERRLNSLNEANLSERLQVLLEALGVTEATLNDLLPELRLPVAVTCYWLRRAQPPPDLKLLKALLLGMTNENVLRAREDLQGEHPHGKPDLVVAHAFNQWQVCLRDSIQLNQLLGFPLPEPDVARLYQGTLVHQLVKKLEENSLDEFLMSNQSADSMELYNKMLSIARGPKLARGPPVADH